MQLFDNEYEALKTYCQIYPTNATLLVDTYNTLKSGVPNAIKDVYKRQPAMITMPMRPIPWSSAKAL